MSSENPAEFNQTLQAWITIFARRLIHDFLMFAHQNGLNMLQINILLTLHYRGPATLAALRQEMYGSRAAATQTIDGLVRSGWVERTEAERDRRLKMITLTAEGRGLVERGIAARRKWLGQLSEAFTPEQRAEIGGMLRTMIDAALELEKGE